MTRKVSDKGIALIQRFEGCAKARPDGKFEAYPDPGTGGDPWTIGWGSTGTGIIKGVVWTQADCDARFKDDLDNFAAKVSELIGNAPTTQGQFDALCCLAYNIGLTALSASTLLRLHKAGDYGGANLQFGRWNKASGIPLPGLTKRRAAEAALYGGAS